MNIYVEKGLITEDQYLKALAYQKSKNIPFHQSLIELSFIKEENVIRYCKNILGY